MNFPIVQVFDFFKEPNKVVEFANFLEWEEGSNYPGLRTKPIHVIDNDLFKNTCEKQLSIFYSQDDFFDLDYKAEMFFQKITSEDTINGEGSIHRDRTSDLTTIIYLSPDLFNNGTNFWTPKTEWKTNIGSDANKKYWHENDKSKRIETIEEAEGYYNKASTVNSIYNSCVMFDGSYNHSANLKLNKGDERLTLITFFYKIRHYRKPISEMRKL